MGVPIFPVGQIRETIPGLRESLSQGISTGVNQAVEQDAINRLLSAINQEQEDPLTAILGSGLPGARQNDLITAFQNQQQIQAKQAEVLAKSAPAYDKVGEKFLLDQFDVQEELGNLQVGIQNVEEALGTGKVSGRLKGATTGRFFPTAADQQLKSGTKAFLGIAKKLFGANVSKEQSKLLADMFPAPGKSEAENRVAFKVMQQTLDLRNTLNEITQNDPSVQSGTVAGRDVARIQRQQKEAINNYFQNLRNQNKVIQELRKRESL